jgi:phage tail tape-measure protein
VAELGDLLIRIDATTEQLRRELKRAESATEGTANKIDKSLAKVDSRFVSMAKTAAKAGLAMAATFGALGAAKLVSVARETDILDAQLKTATGSAEAAASAFQSLERIEAETPYSLQQVVGAFVKLKNLGLDPSRDALMSYGNTASAMGKSLDQMIEAVADASTGEFERLKEFGIRAKNQGDTIAFTFRGITQTVKNNAAEIEGYLRKIGDTEFAGAMTDRANSLDGALSNLGDSWDALFRTISRGPIGALGLTMTTGRPAAASSRATTSARHLLRL